MLHIYWNIKSTEVFNCLKFNYLKSEKVRHMPFFSCGIHIYIYIYLYIFPLKRVSKSYRSSTPPWSKHHILQGTLKISGQICSYHSRAKQFTLWSHSATICILICQCKKNVSLFSYSVINCYKEQLFLRTSQVVILTLAKIIQNHIFCSLPLWNNPYNFFIFTFAFSFYGG